MNADRASHDPQRLAPSPRQKVRLRFWRMFALVAAGVMAAGSVAVIALFLGRYWAPSLLFPLLMGALLGALLGGLSRSLNFGHRPMLVAITVLLALGLTLGQHYLHFHHWQQQRQEQFRALGAGADQLVAAAADRERMLFVPDFGDYLRQNARAGRAWCGMSLSGISVWASWITDGVLTLLSAMGVSWSLARCEWCTRCESFYRLTRRKEVDAELAAKVAILGGLVAQPARAATLEFKNCSEGCVPSKLSVHWKNDKLVDIAWLDEPTRRQVDTLLSQADGEITEQAVPSTAKDSAPS